MAGSAKGVLGIMSAYEDRGAVIFGQVVKVSFLAFSSAGRESDV